MTLVVTLFVCRYKTMKIQLIFLASIFASVVTNVSSVTMPSNCVHDMQTVNGTVYYCAPCKHASLRHTPVNAPNMSTMCLHEYKSQEGSMYYCGPCTRELTPNMYMNILHKAAPSKGFQCGSSHCLHERQSSNGNEYWCAPCRRNLRHGSVVLDSQID